MQIEQQDRLEGACRRFEASYNDIVEARMSLLAWERVRPHLGGVDSDGVLLQAWLWDHVLAACRRALGEKPNELSVRQALRSLLALVDGLTPHAMAVHQVEFHSAASRDLDELTAMVLRQVNSRLTERGHAPIDVTDSVGRHFIQADRDSLKELGNRTAHLATTTVAHRLHKRAEVVTIDDVQRLLRELSAVVVRWSSLLRGVHIIDDIEHMMVGRRLQAALGTYHHHAFTAARVQLAKGRAKGPGPWWEDLDRLEVSYHFRKEQ